jgi:GNAT superfamily N-acetyltransferase
MKPIIRAIIYLILIKGMAFANFQEESIRSICAQGFEIFLEPPTAQEFVELRAIAGMRERKIASAEKGVKNSLFWVILRHQGKLIGMGRLVGDGGTVVQITDIVVHPEHQRKGCGKFILNTIQKYILTEIPDDAFVCLFAEKEISPFYESKGFEFSQDKWPGMYWPCLERINIKSQNYH